MKKLILALTIIALIFGAVSCNGDVDERLFGDHDHYYAIQSDGSWLCTMNCSNPLLAGTNQAYITVLDSDGQPTQIISLTENADVGTGGKITVEGTTVKYTNEGTTAQTVVIRTNGESLIVDDESIGRIYHYNKAGSVNLIECHTDSYHEFGVVSFVEIAEGRLVLEKGSDVSVVHIDKEYTDKSAGTKESSKFGNVEVSVADGVVTPVFSRDTVENINENGTKVCTLDLAGEKNDVVLFQDGIYEQIKVENATDGSRWVDTSNATQTTKIIADQLANNIGGTKGTDYTITGDGETEGTRAVEVVPGHEDIAKVTDKGSVGIVYVKNMAELQSALESKAKYICFANDISYPTNGQGLVNITYSCTIDGAGYSLSGWGSRGTAPNTVYPTLAINLNGDSFVNVSLKNLTINNGVEKGRPLEARGNIESIDLNNVTINATGGGNTQCLTIGGSQENSATININNSSFDAGASGYPIITFNPVDLRISDSSFDGYCGIYLKNDVYGSFGSKISAIDSKFNAPNVWYFGSNDFGVFVLDTDNIEISLNNCEINADREGTANQSVIQENYMTEFKGAYKFTIDGSNSVVNGIISDCGYKAGTIELKDGIYSLYTGPVIEALSEQGFQDEYPGEDYQEYLEWVGSFENDGFKIYKADNENIKLYGGTYNVEPSGYLADGYKAIDNGDGTWTVVKK